MFLFLCHMRLSWAEALSTSARRQLLAVSHTHKAALPCNHQPLPWTYLEAVSRCVECLAPHECLPCQFVLALAHCQLSTPQPLIRGVLGGLELGGHLLLTRHHLGRRRQGVQHVHVLFELQHFASDLLLNCINSALAKIVWNINASTAEAKHQGRHLVSKLHGTGQSPRRMHCRACPISTAHKHAAQRQCAPPPTFAVACLILIRSSCISSVTLSSNTSGSSHCSVALDTYAFTTRTRRENRLASTDTMPREAAARGRRGAAPGALHNIKTCALAVGDIVCSWDSMQADKTWC